MATKKNTEATGQVRITCPACKSAISSDGATLHQKSEYLDGLIETDAGVDELEKTIGILEKKLADAKADAAAAREDLGKSAQRREEPKSVVTKQNGGAKPKPATRGDWW